MTRLADVDASREGHFHSHVAICRNSGLLIVDMNGGDGRVVRDLLRNQVEVCIAITELSEEYLAQDGVQRLFEPSARGSSKVELCPVACNNPLEDYERACLYPLLMCDGGKKAWA